MKYNVKIDYGRHYRFDSFEEASVFIQTALRASTQDTPEIEVSLIRDTEEEAETEWQP